MLFPSVECKVKDSRRLGMFQSCIRMSRSCFHIFEFFDLFLFLLLFWLKYFTENIDAIWVSSFKIRAKFEISVRLTLQTSLVMSCLICRTISFSNTFAKYAFLVYVAMLYMNYPRCGDCAFSANFLRECTDVSL